MSDSELDNTELDQSDLEILDEVDKEKPDDKSKETPDDRKDAPRDGKETEEELEDEEELEPEIKDEEEVTGDKEKDVAGSKLRPSIKMMLEKVPEAKKLFEEFPQLRDAYYREAQLSQLFPDLEAAKEAHEKSLALDSFNDFVMSGSAKELLEAVGKESKDALANFAKDFIPSLGKMDGDLFFEVVTPVVNTVIRNLYKAGEKGKDNNQMAAAQILAKFLYNSTEIPEDEAKAKDPELEAERLKLKKERESYSSELAQEFETQIQGRTKNLMSKVISEGLDPNGTLSEFTKSKIVEEVIERVGVQLESDPSHMAIMSRHWKNAQSGRFSKQYADRILSAFLSRAKQLIPEIRSKVKSEALGKSKPSSNGRRVQTTEVTAGTKVRETPSKNEMDPKKINWRKTSDKDILG